jgi:PPK2 family polyphosphate:nucleotide phosphotransferase
MEGYRINPGSRLKLKTFDPDCTGSCKKTTKGKAEAKARTARLTTRLSELQERLYADGRRALLIVLQGMDTSGKDGTIKHVMSGVNPQGCRVATFRAPSPREQAYDFLWRVHREVPPKGHIGIFNRSHYEDVLITRVHGWVSDAEVKRRFSQIMRFEQLLYESGTAVLKFYLHLSKNEQKERLEARIQDPAKRWKFNEGDLEERTLWDEYMRAFEDVISATSTAAAPWYIVPANHKWYRNLVVAERVVQALESMDLSRPAPPPGIDFNRIKIV